MSLSAAPVRIMESYLSQAPISIGLVRAIECSRIAGLDLRGSVLDIGCGDGLFTDILFEGRRSEVHLTGVDMDYSEVRLARRRGCYDQVLVASGGLLPFPAETFDVVLCNSVLEHIPHPGTVLREMRRVLKPGGTLVLTLPSTRLEHFFFYTMLLNAIGLSNLGKSYADLKNKSWKHFNLWPESRWRETLTHQGFTVHVYEEILSVWVTAICDIMLPFAISSVFVKKVLQRMLLFPSSMKGTVQTLLLKSFLFERPQQGAGIFLVATKAEDV